MEKKTLILGASDNPSRFSYKAIRSLQRREIPVVAIGRNNVQLEGIEIQKGKPEDVNDIHTVSLYMNAKLQQEFYDYIFSLNPKRLIFNPGTRNPELANMAKEKNIEVVDDCMLVMLNTGRF